MKSPRLLLVSALLSCGLPKLAFAEEAVPTAEPKASTAAEAGTPKADGSNASSSADDVVKVREITIVGRIQKPIAAVDVSRIQPKMTLAELRQPFLDRIERAIYHAPF